MKTLLLAVITAVVLVLVGWLSFSITEDKASINIETQEVAEDTAEVVQEGNELAIEAMEMLNEDEPDEVESSKAKREAERTTEEPIGEPSDSRRG